MNVLKHVFRRFGMAPTFTAIALVTLALGIGANTAIFSVINGVLIKPLPYPQAQNLVEVRHLAPGIPSIGGTLNCSPSMYFTYRDENQTFQDFGLWTIRGGTITGVGDPEELRAIMVTDGVLEAVGVKPAVGRWFSRADDTPGAPDTVMLTYGYWQRKEISPWSDAPSISIRSRDGDRDHAAGLPVSEQRRRVAPAATIRPQ
jgi:hypothetical protein